MKLTQKRLMQIVTYAPDTGIFTWNKNRGSTARAGHQAGTKADGAYVRIGIDYTMYLGHNLAFLYMVGYLPENTVDHRNRIRNDNRWSNLREVTQMCNIRNTPNFAHNTSGVKGVTYHKTRKRWFAQIKIKQKNISIKVCKDYEEAVCHRLAFEQCIGWSGCDDNSPAYLYVTNMNKS